MIYYFQQRRCERRSLKSTTNWRQLTQSVAFKCCINIIRLCGILAHFDVGRHQYASVGLWRIYVVLLRHSGGNPEFMFVCHV
jgi:hypothetical protein